MYNPQVEAISPTLPTEDKSELSTMRSSKDELLQSISKVDREISKVEQQITKLKKKQVRFNHFSCNSNYLRFLCRDVIISRISEKSHVGSLWPTVVYIRINDVYVVLAMLRLVSRVSHYSLVTSLLMKFFT